VQFIVPGFDSFAQASAVSLLFDRGQRPAAADIRGLAQDHPDFSISFDPGSRAGGAGDRDQALCWLELLASGLTFDLSGLAPGAGDVMPPRAHAYALAANVPDRPLEAITLSPGPHLAGGQAMMPVVRCLAWLAARLAVLPGVRAVVWQSARCWTGPDHFRTAVLRWMDGGAFPGLGLAAFAAMPDGAMQSEGLALFTGQEIRIEADPAIDAASAVKLGLRLLHLLVESGPVLAPQILTLSGGVAVRLEPSTNGRYVRVWLD
jgi:hypothetical protein